MHAHVELTILISSVLHESQKERGMSVEYLSSNGKKFSNILASQRKELDKKIAALKEYVSSLSQNKQTVFDENIQASLQQISQLSNVRAQTDSLTLSKSDLMKYYGGIHKKLIGTISSIIKESSDLEVVKYMNAYLNYLRIKEEMGLERAVGTAAFASKDVSNKVKIRLSSYISRQDAFIECFLTDVAQNDIDQYKKLENSDTFKYVHTMVDELLYSKSKNELNTEAPQFFKAMTQKIRLVKSLEDKLSKSIPIIMQTHINKSYKSFYEIIIFNLLLIIILIILGVMIIKGITTNVAKLLLNMHKIHTGNYRRYRRSDKPASVERSY